MPANNIQFPGKTREFHNHHFDSTVWNDFKFRDGDIVIGAWGKSGTTWTRQIAGQLLFRAENNARYKAAARRELGDECASWLLSGGGV